MIFYLLRFTLLVGRLTTSDAPADLFVCRQNEATQDGECDSNQLAAAQDLSQDQPVKNGMPRGKGIRHGEGNASDTFSDTIVNKDEGNARANTSYYCLTGSLPVDHLNAFAEPCENCEHD